MSEEYNLCCVNGCVKKSSRLIIGMCEMHYARMRRKGHVGSPLSYCIAEKDCEGDVDLLKKLIRKRMSKNSTLNSNGCMEWNLARNRQGYGQTHITNKRYYCHRLSAWASGMLNNLGSDLLVCHTCDNPSCVNPKHLFVGTHSDNSQDCARKGRRRQQSGEANSMARLTNADIPKIRYLFGKLSDVAIAERFGVSPSTIARVRNRICWIHV